MAEIHGNDDDCFKSRRLRHRGCCDRTVFVAASVLAVSLAYSYGRVCHGVLAVPPPLSVCLSMSVHLSVCLSLCLSVCLSVCFADNCL